MTARDTLTIAHWATNFSLPLASLDDWTKLVEAQLQAARAEKADILLMPEHAAEHWMYFAPRGLMLQEETGWMAENANKIKPKLQSLAEQSGVALVAGSTSWRHEKTGNCRNRSWMFFPDRAPVFHDKLVLTPSEKDAESGWLFETGDEAGFFDWRGFRLSLVICLDVEMPALAHRLAGADIDLLLVPSMTTKPAGYYRVFNCARARAVELMTAVAVVGNVGGAKKAGNAREMYHSGAAVYIPSEEAFGHTGIFSDLPLHGQSDGAGRTLYSRDIPLEKIRLARHGTPEAWPGPWDAGHVKLVNKG
jgi:predicted amidohydrolase